MQLIALSIQTERVFKLLKVKSTRCWWWWWLKYTFKKFYSNSVSDSDVSSAQREAVRLVRSGSDSVVFCNTRKNSLLRLQLNARPHWQRWQKNNERARRQQRPAQTIPLGGWGPWTCNHVSDNILVQKPLLGLPCSSVCVL